MDNYEQRFANRFMAFANANNRNQAGYNPLCSLASISMHYIHSRKYRVISEETDRLYTFKFMDWSNLHQLDIFSMSDGIAGIVMRNSNLVYMHPLSFKKKIMHLSEDENLASLALESVKALSISRKELEFWEYAFQDVLNT